MFDSFDRKKAMAIAVLVLPVLAVAAFWALDKVPATGDIPFRDARGQAAEFIGYYHSITLTPAQESIKQQALTAIPAPCCADYSIATCCCPCNLAKSVWGLSNYLIAERGYDVERLKRAAEDWMRFTNEGGYTGTACYDGHCNKPFEENGCGGMNEKRIT